MEADQAAPYKYLKASPLPQAPWLQEAAGWLLGWQLGGWLAAGWLLAGGWQVGSQKMLSEPPKDVVRASRCPQRLPDASSCLPDVSLMLP